MAVAEDLPVTRQQTKAGTQAKEVLASRLQQPAQTEEEIVEEERRFAEERRRQEPPPAPKPVPRKPVPGRPPEKVEEPEPEPEPVGAPSARDLNEQARRIAERTEKRTGVPADITFDRLRDAPGWREREIAFLAKQTKTSKKEVDKIIQEGGGIGDREENQGLELARATLLSKLRFVPPKEKVEEVELKPVRRPGERAINVGTKTSKPGAVRDTPEIRKLAKDDPALFKILIQDGIAAFNRAVAAEKFVFQQETKRFNEQNTQLPKGTGEKEGRFVSNAELARLKRDNPEVHKVFLAQGFKAGAQSTDKFNAGVEKQNKEARIRSRVLEGDVPKELSKAEVIKTVWRVLTPWDEDAGQTYLQYMKRFPERLKDTFISNLKGGVQESQESLKAEFEANRNAPFWARVLFAPDIVFNKKTNTYTRFMLAEVPQIGKKPPKLAVKERIDWAKITDAINRGQVKSAAEASKWAKINKALSPAQRKLDKEGGQARTQQVVKALDAASKRQAAIKAAKEAEISKQREFLQRFVKSTTKGNKNIGDINKAIADRLAKIKQGATAKTAVVPSLSLTLDQLNDLKQMVGVETATRLQTETQRLESIKTKKLTQTQLANELALSEELLTKLQNQIKEQTQTKTATAVIVATALAVAQATDTVNETEVKRLIKQQTENLTETKLRTDIKEQLETIREEKLDVKKLETVDITTTDQPPPKIKKPPPKTGEPGRPVEQIKTIRKDKLDLKGRRGKLKFPAFGGKQDKINRREIQKAKGAIAWRQGELRGKDRWDVVVSPYTKDENYTIVLGRKPVGAIIIRGPGSAFKTARLIFGQRLEKKVAVNQPGIFSTILEPTDKRNIKLTFERDFILSKKVGNLDEKGRVFPLP